MKNLCLILFICCVFRDDSFTASASPYIMDPYLISKMREFMKGYKYTKPMRPSRDLDEDDYSMISWTSPPGKRQASSTENNFQLRLRKNQAAATADRYHQLRLKKPADQNYQLRLRKKASADGNYQLRLRKADQLHNNYQLRLRKSDLLDHNYQLRLRKSGVDTNYQLRLKKESPSEEEEEEDNYHLIKRSAGDNYQLRLKKSVDSSSTTSSEESPSSYSVYSPSVHGQPVQYRIRKTPEDNFQLRI